jgi:flagellar basal body rod protein FlgG
MLYGLYQSSQGAQAQSMRLDVVANNLANAATSGFKRDLAVFQSHRTYDVENGLPSDAPGHQERLSGGTTPAQVVTDFSNGSMIQTGGSLDLALAGPGFFQVTDGRNEYLTRNGRFTTSRAGELVTAGSGLRVLSQSGTPLVIPSDTVRIDATADGSLSATSADGSQAQIGRIALVRPTGPPPAKVGDSLYRALGRVEPADSDLQVKQGYVEASGVNPVSEMMELIQASRAYESNVSMIKFQDDALGRLLQSAGTR